MRIGTEVGVPARHHSIGRPDKVTRAFEELAGNPVVARGAYLAKLVTDMKAGGRPVSIGGEAG